MSTAQRRALFLKDLAFTLRLGPTARKVDSPGNVRIPSSVCMIGESFVAHYKDVNWFIVLGTGTGYPHSYQYLRKSHSQVASSSLHWMTPHCTCSPSHFCLLPHFHLLCLQPSPDDLGGWNGDWALKVSIAEIASGCWTFIMLAQIVTQRRTRKMSAMSMNHAFMGGCSWTFMRIWTTTWCHC